MHFWTIFILTRQISIALERDLGCKRENMQLGVEGDAVRSIKLSDIVAAEIRIGLRACRKGYQKDP